MEISDEDLRAMVRDAVAHHGGRRAHDPAAVPDACAGHASHFLLPLVSSGDSDGQCLIEPALRCTHCGYCRSMGH